MILFCKENINASGRTPNPAWESKDVQGYLQQVGWIHYTFDFRDVVSDLDVVYDTMGGDTHMRSYAVLKPGGLLVCLNAEPIPDEKPRKDIRVETPLVRYDRAGVERIVQLLQTKAVQPNVETVYFLTDAIDAYRLSESNHARGKLVLRMK